MRINRVYLPGLRRARLDAGLSSRRLAELVSQSRVRGSRGPSVGKTTIQDWEQLFTSAPEWVVPFLAAAIGCSGKKLTEAA